MSSVLVLGIVVGMALIVGAIGTVITLSRRPAPSPSQAAGAARRHAAGVHAGALALSFGSAVAGTAIVAGLPLGPGQGRYLGLLPATAGLVFAAVQAVGELTWPRPTGTVRRAPLARRTSSDVAPAGLRRLTWAWAALVAVTLVACGLASDDGRGLTRAFAGGSSGASPFPGWFYGAPLLAASVVVLIATECVLRLIARRPAVMDAAPDWDLLLRRTSARRLLRAGQLALGWTGAGALLIAGNAVLSLGIGGSANGVSTGSRGYEVAGAALLLLGGGAWLASLVALVAPGRLGAVAGEPDPSSPAPSSPDPSAGAVPA